MSKTDKTDPDWVRCQWEPWHHPRCVERSDRKITYLDCDLPPEPERGHPIYISWRVTQKLRRCKWAPITPNYYSPEGYKFYGRHRHVHRDANLLERGTRAAWRDCAKKLLATPIDEIDDVMLPDPRHRHLALWLD